MKDKVEFALDFLPPGLRDALRQRLDRRERTSAQKVACILSFLTPRAQRLAWAALCAAHHINSIR